MIEPTKGPRGQERARCVCDDCGADAVVAAAHGHAGTFRKAGAGRNGQRQEHLANEAQATTKLKAKGWSFIRNVARCPDCEAKRKASVPAKPPVLVLVPKETQPMTMPATAPVASPRQPTREQKRQIIDLLNEVYDTKAERYRGKDTDQTVAEVLGTGIMSGWVSQIREELFGPDGGNDEIEHLRAELADLNKLVRETVSNATTKLQEAQAALKSVAETERKIAELTKRVEAVKAAVGPKARSA